jgi:hypothetical protein
VDIQLDSTEAIAGMPVWLDVDVADEHAGFRSHPAGGPIPPTYRIDPREVHHAPCLSCVLRTPFFGGRDRQSV